MANGRLAFLQPVIQYGFAGMSVILLGIVCWQIDKSERFMRDMMKVQIETNQAIERNTSAFRELSRIVHDKL